MRRWAWWAAKATALTLAATVGGLPGVAGQSGSGPGLGATVSQAVQRVVAPVTAVLGAGRPAPVLKTVPVLGPLTAVRAGDRNVPAATQLAGLGALPGLADLPAAARPAANSGMNSVSFAVLAVGALLTGASALKIAGRRARDRRSGPAA